MYKHLASMLIGLQATDGFMTVWATRHGFIEQNQLMAPIAHTWMLPLLKIGVTLLVMAFLIPLTRKYRKPIIGGLAAGNSIMATVVALNVLELV